MTKRKSKISYRDLLAQRPADTHVIVPPDAMPHDTVPATPPAPLSSTAPAPAPAEARSHAESPPPPVVTRSSTPITLAVVLNAPTRLTPIGSATIPASVRGAPAPTAVPPPMRMPTSPRIAPRGTRRVTRATIAGRIALDSAIRTDLAATGKCELLRFRIGPERFALRLADVEEAVEAPVLHPLPDQPRHVLGVLAMRGRLVPVHAPAHVLGVGIGSLGVALVLVGDPPLALAVDDVEDVLTIEPRALREAPGVDDPDGVLIGVTRHNGKLVGVLDAPALALACLAPVMPELR